MLTRLSGRPAGVPGGSAPRAQKPDAVIERFFALLERLAPPPALETKSRKAKSSRPRPRRTSRGPAEDQASAGSGKAVRS
jgi:hypothetical protein